MAKSDGLVKREREAITITTERARITLATLEAEKETRAALAGFVAEMMKADVDFGIIPGTDKPTLLKPGAEKLVDLFRCTPSFSLVKDQCRQDFERGFFKYTFRCRLTQGDAGRVVAEGFGSANSHESRYRWRTASRKCPSCGKAAIIAGKKEYGGGFVCFKKKDGCGAKFAETDPAITAQPVGRVPNEDIADLDNTILKMAKKRALVDGAIALARCSDMFTQDVEDLRDMAAELEPAGYTPEPTPPPTPAPTPSPQERAAKATESLVYGEHGAPKAEAEKAKQNTETLLGALVAFGPYKGRRIDVLSDEELADTISEGHERIRGTPNARWVPSVREHIRALESEVQRRLDMQAMESSEPPEAHSDTPAGWEVWVGEVDAVTDAAQLAGYYAKMGTLDAGTVGRTEMHRALQRAEARLKA